MLNSKRPLAIFMTGHLGDRYGKMGYGILRFSPNPVVCVVDPNNAGRMVSDVIDTPRDVSVVANVAAAAAMGAEVLVLGITPSGGLLPEDWLEELQQAVTLGMSIVNGLHNPLAPRFPKLKDNQFVWDVRTEPTDIGVGSGAARLLKNTRVLMLGTDMACGKMTAGILLVQAARARGLDAEFVATGQVGITIWGRGIPLDAIKLDYACGAMEKAVLDASGHDIVVVEGQGSIVHPGSSATLPLLRGTCPTHIILCHRAGMTRLSHPDWVPMPPLRDIADLYEKIATACGAMPETTTAAISLNTYGLSDADAEAALKKTADQTGLPVTDPVRFGAECLVDAVQNS